MGEEALEISIHAPPRGATRFQREQVNTSPFQFTPLREGRRVNHDERYGSITFQFTPLREGRHDFGG